MEIKQFSNNIFFHVKAVTLIYAALIAIDWIFDIFPEIIRFGIKSTRLIYSHPTVFVACCVLLIMVLLSVSQNIAGYKLWLIILLILMCTTLRSKAWGTALTVVLIYTLYSTEKTFRLRNLLMFVPLVILLGWEQIEYYFFSSIQSDSARY